MDDRELLELAAKAAGITNAIFYDACPEDGFPTAYAKIGKGQYWTPFTDDGDAMRLMVVLGLSVIREKMEVLVRDYTGHYLDGPKWITEDIRPDAAAATRRAITRAAAKIGKALP